jgi:cellulose synthase/poly-beta-1,6-N-acetylglucosamine synthase-like glycosyltransferase
MSLSLCITAYDQDYKLIYNLLTEFAKQTKAPSEIVFYCSGKKFVEDIPSDIKINNVSVPIITIFNSKRTNQARARNICSKVAIADYVMFFDVDDIPHPMKIELAEKILLQNKEFKFFLHNYNQTQNYINLINDEIPQSMQLFPITEIDKNSTNVLCGNYPIHHAHITVEYQVLQKISFNESLSYYRKEDGKFCQDLILNGYQGLYCPHKLVHYIS